MKNDVIKFSIYIISHMWIVGQIMDIISKFVHTLKCSLSFSTYLFGKNAGDNDTWLPIHLKIFFSISLV